jgi:ABC-type transporter Mla subunit MlaD
MEPEFEDRFQQHEAIMTSLARMVAAQHEFNRQQVEINQDVKTTLERVETTLARVETLLARIMRDSDNGNEA